MPCSRYANPASLRYSAAVTLVSTPLAQIAEQHLQALIADEVREGRRIDYKRETYGGNDDARAEFLADISSFANSGGGDIIIGMDEKDGLPFALPGLNTSVDLDAETLRLEQIARAGLQPRIAGIAFHPVTLASGCRALVIRVPRSYEPPHRVIFKGRNRFWARSSAGKFEPDVGELRVLFNLVPHLAERIREFRATRIGQVVTGGTPLPLKPLPGRIIVHVVPFASVETADFIDIEAVMQQPSAWFPWGASGLDYRVNFDGAVFFPGGDGTVRAYVQVLRTGAVESVATDLVRENAADGKFVPVPSVVGKLLENVTRIAGGLRALDVTSPLAVSVTMMDVQGAKFIFGDPFFRIETPLPATRDTLTFVEAVIPDGEKRRDRVAVALKPIFDQIYQTGGATACDLFDSEGKPRR